MATREHDINPAGVTRAGFLHGRVGMRRLKSTVSRLTPMPPRLGYAPSDERARDKHREKIKPWRAWYRTSRWQKLRRVVFERDDYMCQRTGILCTGSGNDPTAPVANHRIPHRGDEALFWCLDNLETVSKEAHDSIVQREERAAER